MSKLTLYLINQAEIPKQTVRFMGALFTLLLLFSMTQKSLGNSLINEVSAMFKKDFVANFESETSDSLNQDTITASGRLFFKKGGLLRFEYAKPDEQLIIVGKKKVWIYDPVLQNVNISNVDKIPSIDSLIFFRQPEKLAQLFFVNSNPKHLLLVTMTGQKLLFLKNYDQNSQLHEIQLAYNAETKLIEQVGIIDHQNNTKIFKFSEFEFPLELVDEKFELIVPTNVEVIEND